MNGAKRDGCLSCGKEFSRKFNFQRHWEIVHGETMDDNKPRSEEEEEEQEEEPEPSDQEDMEDNEVYRDWYEEAVQANQEPRNRKYQKYLEEDADDARARQKAYAKTLLAIKGHFFDYMETFLIQTVQLRDDDALQDIVADIDEKTEKGMDLNKAVKKVLPKHKHKFESLFEFDPEEEDEEEEEDADNEEADPAPPSMGFYKPLETPRPFARARKREAIKYMTKVAHLLSFVTHSYSFTYFVAPHKRP